MPNLPARPASPSALLLRSGRPYEWVRVSDEWGSELALGVVGLELCCHPISMIERRLEDEELVDIARLVEMTVEQLATLLSEVFNSSSSPTSS